MPTPQRTTTVSLHLHPTVSVSAIPVPVAELLANLIIAHLHSGDAGRDAERDAALQTLANDLDAVVAHANR